MKVIKIHDKDNVAVATASLPEGTVVSVSGEKIKISEPIPAGHKFAIKDIGSGEAVIKYAYPIGSAKTDIKKGQHIHTKNLSSNLGDILSYSYSPDFSDLPPLPAETFKGFRRADGKVGIRNEVWIIPTVGCVNSIAKEIEKAAAEYKTENIDGIYSYSHPYGCSQLGEDQNNTLKALSGFIRHPNAAAVLVIGLGCENGNIGELKKFLGEYDPERVRFMVCQEETDEILKGKEILKELCQYADSFKREDIPANELIIGLKCGGSDGFSGITANALVGEFSDILVSKGGSTVLTEVPEMFGAETILMNRCRNKDIFQKTVSLINNFKAYFMKYGEKINENPSPGNKAGGISTLEEKSLGCVQKSGTAPIEDVLLYGDEVKRKGVSLLNAPGNDLVASCALAASGAHIVLFTTGRGTPFCCPVPTVKISSNSTLYCGKKNWIDFNAGEILEGTDKKELANRLYRYVLDLASGRISAKSEKLDKTELAIFKDGVTL